MDVSNYLQNKNIPILEIICVSTPPYYLYWFEKKYPNVTLNWYYGPFGIQYIIGIKGTKPELRQWNILPDAVATVTK